MKPFSILLIALCVSCTPYTPEDMMQVEGPTTVQILDQGRTIQCIFSGSGVTPGHFFCKKEED